MLPTACHLRYLNFDKVFNWSWDCVIFCVPVTKLSENPASPTQKHSIFGNSSCMMIPRRNLNEFVLRLHWLRHFFIIFFPITTSAIFSWAPHVNFWWRYLNLRSFRKKCLHHFHLAFLDHLNAIRGSRHYLIFFIIIVSGDRLESSPLRIQNIMSVKNFRGEDLFMLHATLRLAHRRHALLVLWIAIGRWIIENLMYWVPLLNRDTTAVMLILILRGL